MNCHFIISEFHLIDKTLLLIKIFSFSTGNLFEPIMLLISHSDMLNFTSLSKSPEGGGSEGVSDGGVDGIVVSPVVAAGQQPQLEDLEHPGAQDDGQPLVVGDVLDHGPYVSPDIIIIITIMFTVYLLIPCL